MSPDSIESRLAEIRTEVRSWEHQIRTFAPAVTKMDVLEERIAGVRRDLDALHSEINERLHTLHDEYGARLREEVQELNQEIDGIVERRDREIGDLRKGIGDLSIAMQSMVTENRTQMMALVDTRFGNIIEDIGEVKQNQAAMGADRTNRRGQNLILIASLITAVLLLAGSILQAIF